MPNYRRVLVPGGTYFFTVVLRDRASSLLVRHVGLLLDAMHHARHRRPFQNLALAVLPDHVHAIWRLPDGDSDYPTRWRHIKTLFAQGLPHALHPSGGGRSGVWQRGYWERLIRDERDLRAHVDYVHYNPVKHGLVARAVDWPHSSIHRYLRQGWLEPGWGEGGPPRIPSAGE